MSSPSYYEILGLDSGADAQAIKSAYRRLALELHPDRNEGEHAAEQFFRVKNAYDALIDPIRRSAYDELQRVRKRQQAQASQQPKASEPTKVDEPPPQAKAPSRASPDDLVRLTAFLSRGRMPEAEKLARKMIGQRANHPIPYAVLGDIAKMRGDLLYASEMYAYAVQLDGRNLIYQRKHDEVSARLAQGARRISTLQPAQNDDNISMLVAALGVLLACVAVVMGTEPAMAPELPMIGSWTWTLLAALALSGFVLGACLSFGGMITRFVQVFSGMREDNVSPSVVVTILGLINFWLAALMHCVIGISHRKFDLTITRILGGAALITLLLSGASAAQGQIDYLQTFLWGGNVVFAGVWLGWLASDAYQEETGRLK